MLPMINLGKADQRIKNKLQGKEMETKRTGLASVLRKPSAAPSKVYCTTSTKELLSTSERCLAYAATGLVLLYFRDVAVVMCFADGAVLGAERGERWSVCQSWRIVPSPR